MQAWRIDAKPFIEMFDECLEDQEITDVIKFIKEMREEVEDGKNSTQRKFS